MSEPTTTTGLTGEEKRLLNKNTGIALGLVIVLIGGVATGVWAVATWNGDLENQKNAVIEQKAEMVKVEQRTADSVARLEGKIDQLTTAVQTYSAGNVRLENDVSRLKNSADSITQIRSEVQALRHRLDLIDATGTTFVRDKVIRRLDSMQKP